MVYLFLLGRVLLGGFFIMSGVKHFKHLASYTGYAHSKGVPMPRYAVMATGVVLLLGGLGIILGVGIKCAVLLLSVFLLVTSFKMHDYWNMPADARMGDEINFYKNMALLGAVLMLLAIPTPWVLALVG